MLETSEQLAGGRLKRPGRWSEELFQGAVVETSAPTPLSHPPAGDRSFSPVLHIGVKLP
jgi:hypothetical protein